MSATVVAARKIICLDREGRSADWLVIEDGVIAEVGPGEAPGGEVVRLDGVVLPGLIDAHVHLTTTGLYASGLDFRTCRSVDELLETLAVHLATTGERWVIGGNFDPGRNRDARMPDRRELDRVAQGRYLLISRADGHSCVLNSAALEHLGLDPSLPGIDRDERESPTGVLRSRANYEARQRFFGMLPEERIRKAQLDGCRLALARGVTSVHEMAGGGYMGDRDFVVLMASRDDYPIHIVPYLATFDIGSVRGAGLSTIGGDLFLDGSIGSRTAAMSDPYEEEEERGSLYHSDDEVVSFFLEATRAGLQAGVHAIGDAAIEQALRCLEEASARLGPERADAARRLGHRIEHFECVSPEQIERAAALGVVASVQPMFDQYWGGTDGMYSARLGKRAESMNPFSLMIRRGLVVAGGSDSTVTPLDPFLGMAAAVNHHEAEFAVSVDQALRMFTIWAAEAAREAGERGSIAPGKVADLCVVADDPMAANAARLASLEVIETWVRGRRVWPPE